MTAARTARPATRTSSRLAQAFVKAAPERLVWGSNWPHPSEPNKPDDAMLFDLMAQWAPDEATRNRILVQNPQTLYGFGKVGLRPAGAIAALGSFSTQGGRDDRTSHIHQARLDGRLGDRVRTFGTAEPRRAGAEFLRQRAGQAQGARRAPATAITTSTTRRAFRPPQPGARMLPNARVEEYRLLQRRLGTSRNVVVTPAAYVVDNRVTLDAIAQLGPNARGVAVVHPDVTDAELKTAGRWRHSRHPLRARRSRHRLHHHRHDRAAVEARERARLARADQHRGRADRGGRGFVESPALGDRVRSHGARAAAGRA